IAMGFMQVTPVAAKDTAQRYKAPYNPARLLSDPIYNMQMGAAELSMLLGGLDFSLSKKRNWWRKNEP
ncbi:MAG: hypothetical protein EBY17_29285, partial [Acidobacteriia bacterium]|nr:hypothetical protein [Terriglobia bacterium]